MLQAEDGICEEELPDSGVAGRTLDRYGDGTEEIHQHPVRVLVGLGTEGLYAACLCEDLRASPVLAQNDERGVYVPLPQGPRANVIGVKASPFDLRRVGETGTEPALLSLFDEFRVLLLFAV